MIRSLALAESSERGTGELALVSKNDSRDWAAGLCGNGRGGGGISIAAGLRVSLVLVVGPAL